MKAVNLLNKSEVNVDDCITILDLVAKVMNCSRSDARRLIKQRAVKKIGLDKFKIGKKTYIQLIS